MHLPKYKHALSGHLKTIVFLIGGLVFHAAAVGVTRATKCELHQGELHNLKVRAAILELK